MKCIYDIHTHPLPWNVRHPGAPSVVDMLVSRSGLTENLVYKLVPFLAILPSGCYLAEEEKLPNLGDVLSLFVSTGRASGCFDLALDPQPHQDNSAEQTW